MYSNGVDPEICGAPCGGCTFCAYSPSTLPATHQNQLSTFVQTFFDTILTGFLVLAHSEEWLHIAVDIRQSIRAGRSRTSEVRRSSPANLCQMAEKFKVLHVRRGHAIVRLESLLFVVVPQPRDNFTNAGSVVAGGNVLASLRIELSVQSNQPMAPRYIKVERTYWLCA